MTISPNDYFGVSGLPHQFYKKTGDLRLNL
jgi:hypothetical protein